jgi:hypothetical protein
VVVPARQPQSRVEQGAASTLLPLVRTPPTPGRLALEVPWRQVILNLREKSCDPQILQ